MPASSIHDALDELERVFRSAESGESEIRQALERLGELQWGVVEGDRMLELATIAAGHPAANPSDRGKARVIAARAARVQTRFKLGLELLQRARRDFRSAADRRGAADCDLVAGAIHTETGKPGAALQAYRRAEAVFVEIDDRRGAASCRYNRGLIHFQRTELQEALECYEGAEATFRELGLRLQAAICRLNVGNVHELAGRYEEALQTFAAVRPEFEELGDADRAARCRLNAGNAFAGSGRHTQAISMFRGAGEVFRSLKNIRLEAASLLNAANSASAIGNVEQALSDYALALEAFQRVEDTMGQGECHLALARVGGSLPHAQEALRLFKRLGDKLHTAAAHESLARLTRGRAAETHWMRAMQSLRTALKGKDGTHLRYVAAERFPDLGPSLVTLALNRGSVQEAAKFAELADFLSLARASSDSTPTVRFVCDRDRLHRLIRSETGWTAQSRPVERDDLQAKCRELKDALSRPGEDSQELRRDLHEIFFGDGTPPGTLHLAAGPPCDGVAFEALLDPNGRCLIERQAIVRGREPGSPFVPVENFVAVTRSSFSGSLRPLPGVEQEIESIRGFWPNTDWLHQERAGVTEVTRRMAKADILHFATHAVEESKNPLASCLVLEPDAEHPTGKLYARDISRLRLRAKLVVLSACDTASGSQSLARAFLDAGADCVIAAAWRAEDVASRLWMSHFYGGLGQARNCAGAHRAAAMRMIESDYRDPHFWALWRVLC